MVFLGKGDDGGPDLPEQLQVFLHGLVGGPAHEGGDHAHAQLLAGQDDLFQVGDIGRPLLQILVHGVGVKGQGGELHAPLLAVAQDIGGLLVGEAVHVDVAHPGVAALGLAGGPAGRLHAGEAQVAGGVDHLLKAPAVQDGADKTKFHIVKTPFVNPLM